MTDITHKAHDWGPLAYGALAAALLGVLLLALVLAAPLATDLGPTDCIMTDNAGCVADPTPGDGPSGVGADGPLVGTQR